MPDRLLRFCPTVRSTMSGSPRRFPSYEAITVNRNRTPGKRENDHAANKFGKIVVRPSEIRETRAEKYRGECNHDVPRRSDDRQKKRLTAFLTREPKPTAPLEMTTNLTTDCKDQPRMPTWSAYQPRDDRFVVFRVRPGCGGLGDRVVGIISTFVLAMVTQRQFRIEWTMPAPLDDTWQPASWVRWNAADHPASARELRLIDQMPGAYGYFVGENVVRDACDNLAVEANQHFFTNLLCNMRLANILSRYAFEPPDRLSTQVLEALFKPSEELDALLEPRYPPLQRANSIGVQIRTLWNWGDAGGYFQREDFENFFACVRTLLSETETNVIFVAADDRRVAGAFRDEFPMVEVLALAGEPVHLDRSPNMRADQNLATFAELHLLAACRHLVISPWSNFGRVAALVAGRPAWVVRKVNGQPFTDVQGAFGQVPLLDLVSKEGLAIRTMKGR
jgi:hypothetical protein